MMRTQRRQRSRVPYVPPGVALDQIAERAWYEGSAEHKKTPSFIGQPKPRRRASMCPPGLDRETVTGWLRSAIRRGMVGGLWEGGFPRLVWHRVGETVFEGRLVNSGSGSYKGYPLRTNQWPRALKATRRHG